MNNIPIEASGFGIRMLNLASCKQFEMLRFMESATGFLLPWPLPLALPILTENTL